MSINSEQKQFEFSAAANKRADEIMALYPDAKSAIMSLLYIVQEEAGYVNDAGIEWVGRKLDIAPVHVREVATFYTMYYKKPVGKYHIQLCRTLPCALCGAVKLSTYFQKKLGLRSGEVSADGVFSFEEVECLGACGVAPMCQINDIYFERLDEAKVDEILERLRKEQPELRFSTLKDALGAGLASYAKSQVAPG